MSALIEAADRVYTIADLQRLQGTEIIEDPSITSSTAEDLSRTEELWIRDESLVVPPTSQVGCGTFDVKSIATVHVTDATEEAPLWVAILQKSSPADSQTSKGCRSGYTSVIWGWQTEEAGML